MRDVDSSAYNFKESKAKAKAQVSPPGIRVPKGGSNCAKCMYLGDDKKTCTNAGFIRWHGSNVIPAPIEEYCSNWFDWEGRK